MHRDVGLLLSIKPIWVDKLLSGEKSVELRRTKPRTWPGMPVVIYASSPRRAIVAMATIDSVEADAPTALWERLRGETGATRHEYRTYFAGASVAFGLRLGDLRPLRPSISLAELREKDARFRPPQSWRYLRACELDWFTSSDNDQVAPLGAWEPWAGRSLAAGD